jgi:hypothetical protein
MMKWLIALAVLMLIISPAFAQVVVNITSPANNTVGQNITVTADGIDFTTGVISFDNPNIQYPSDDDCGGSTNCTSTTATCDVSISMLILINDSITYGCQVDPNWASGGCSPYVSYCHSGTHSITISYSFYGKDTLYFTLQNPASPIPVIGSMALVPISGSHTVGTSFDVNVTADSGGINIDGIDALLTYDSSKLSVTNLVMTNGLTNITFKNYTSSTITFSQLAPFGTQIPLNTTVATITFMPTGIGNASVNFLFTLGNTTDSNIAVNGTDILNSTTNGVYAISAAPPGPTPQPPIHGATAGIIGFLPLLIGVGLILFIARRIEDMKSTEDFIIVIVGAGLGIVFLGVFTAIIAGLI